MLISSSSSAVAWTNPSYTTKKRKSDCRFVCTRLRAASPACKCAHSTRSSTSLAPPSRRESQGGRWLLGAPLLCLCLWLFGRSVCSESGAPHKLKSSQDLCREDSSAQASNLWEASSINWRSRLSFALQISPARAAYSRSEEHTSELQS